MLSNLYYKQKIVLQSNGLSGEHVIEDPSSICDLFWKFSFALSSSVPFSEHREREMESRPTSGRKKLLSLACKQIDETSKV